MSEIRLSILICSLESRKDLLNRLLNVLEKQKTEQIEICILTDSGEYTTGHKRNLLLDEAVGDYITFVDDDDLVSEDYVPKILKAIETNPDCCGMEGLITFQKRNITRKFIHSIKYDHWFTKNEIYYRCPNHLSPVDRKLAMSVKFPDITVGEDKIYSNKLFPLLKTEVYIEGPIYYYLTS